MLLQSLDAIVWFDEVIRRYAKIGEGALGSLLHSGLLDVVAATLLDAQAGDTLWGNKHASLPYLRCFSPWHGCIAGSCVCAGP